MSEFIHKVQSITSQSGPQSTIPHLYPDFEEHEHEHEHEQQHPPRRSHEFHSGESKDVESAHNINSNYYVPAYDEKEVTVKEWFQYVFANPLQFIKHYLISLFPIASWILHYNYKWLYGDLVAGITVGVVLVPQSMSYAQLAGLEPQYGLYSSFVGVFIYSFFATSKDVSIGPVAVMSLQVGKVVAHVQSKYGDQYAPAEIATFLALICGGIATGIGILRLGFILEFISIPAVMGFMTGSAFNIISGQVPALMGYNSKVNTRDATYHVIINTLKNLPHTKVDAAFGLVSLFILYLWKFGTEWAQKRWPRYKMYFFYFQQLRNAVVIIVATAISWGIVHPKKIAFEGPKNKFKPPFSTIGDVPSGLRHVGVMTIPDGILGAMASEIPVSTVILLLEHIAISKSFGRVNDYKVVPDQEVIAIGVNNLIGTFFNAYPATGSFSRSALKAKCGVRTPLAGIFTGCVVLLALYALTSSFYYIPKAVLSAVIIHAVSDLMANYKVTWSFWKISPIDCGIFLIGVILTVFVTIEAGIYFAIAASLVVLLWRIALPNGLFLGKVQVAEIINPIIEQSSSSIDGDDFTGLDSSDSSDIEIHQILSRGSNYRATEETKTKDNKNDNVQDKTTTFALKRANPQIRFHTRWVPLNKKNINKGLNVTPPPPGVLVFKPLESFTYPNASRQIDRVSDEAKRLTKRAKPYSATDTGSRPWNDPGPLKWNLPFLRKYNVAEKHEEDTRPILRIIHFDFSTVSQIDVTSIQALVDLRKALNAYADREVEFHFSGILSPWIRRGLLNAGFGTYEDGLTSSNNYVDIATGYDDLEGGIDEQYLAAVGTNTPFFHLDIPNYQ
ncbi:SUL2 [Candida oxycetoniae]|uniref:SUL2 n=1 Tax=Candida oxycetoniae TaxID=497107 RepID=A0AAI9SXI6_9ASCO|nr:SUL2 [Candida oxycetoniae]KAI3404625.2 SUL2 [Candida oxycetoniae]